jgi:hypothetical protein
MNTPLTQHYRLNLKEIILWGLAEVTLSLTGLDQIAAYSEYLHAHNLSAYAIGSKIVQILTLPEQGKPIPEVYPPIAEINAGQ